MCDACMKFDSECSNSDFQEKECSSATYDNQLHIREGSPDITVQKVTESSLFSSKFFVLPKRDPKIVSTRKYQEDDISNLEEDFEFQSTFLSASNQHDSFLQQVQKDTPERLQELIVMMNHLQVLKPWMKDWKSWEEGQSQKIRYVLWINARI
ncbi:uncharacterized protein LOC124815573 [Hydra vulgaris]|uniref:uncharacterized protein LOC124815573 n=1 Tax=Hydra vulgaris TaxID=6087 RepID=UPI0032EA56E0